MKRPKARRRARRPPAAGLTPNERKLLDHLYVLDRPESASVIYYGTGAPRGTLKRLVDKGYIDPRILRRYFLTERALDLFAREEAEYE